MRVPVKEIILCFKRSRNILKTSKELGISRQTVYRWLKRARVGSREALKYQGLGRKSTKPKTVHWKVTSETSERIISLREDMHLGSRKIKYMLGVSFSERTIHRFLKRKGKIPKLKNYRRPLFQNGHAMRPVNTKGLGYLQMDTKHVTPELSGLQFTVYEYAAIDIFSRFKLAVILPDISSDSASLALQYFLKWFPFEIKYVQTDNGLEFQRTFQEICIKKNLKHYFIHKNSPNENAVIERSFRTDQDEFYFWLNKEPNHIGELNTWLQEFIKKYNFIRPHQSLNYLTPNQVVILNL
ncbi:MAG: integrase core domain-containing protein [Nanoarchaeota archaeon]